MQGPQTTGTDDGVEAAIRHLDGRHVQHIFAEGWMMQGGGYHCGGQLLVQTGEQ